MPQIEIKDLNEDVTITEEELKHVKGGLLSTYKLSYYKIAYQDPTVDTFLKFY